jgi:hypothetical protein
MGSEIAFEVSVNDYNTSVDEWLRSGTVPKAELPRLTKLQKTVARKMRVSEEDYQRNLLAGQLGQMRLRSRGQALGLAIQDSLRGLGAGYRLDAVRGELDNCRWICRIEASGQAVNVTISRELADDVLDLGSKEAIEKLNRCLRASLGLGGSTEGH